MQTSGRINYYNISSLCFSRRKSIESDGSRVSTHRLFYQWNLHTIGPNLKLINCCCTERIGSAQNYLFTGSFKMIGQLPDSSSFSNSIYTHYHDNIGFAALRKVKILQIVAVIFFEQTGNFFFKHRIQLRSPQVFISRNSFFNTLNDLQGCFHTNIRRNQNFFEIIQYLIVNLRFSNNGATDFRKNAFLGFCEPLIEAFFFLTVKNPENTHSNKVLKGAS